MLVRATVNLDEEGLDPTELVMSIDEEIYFDLPSREQGCGILKAVQWRGNGLVRVYIEPCVVCRDKLVAQYN